MPRPLAAAVFVAAIVVMTAVACGGITGPAVEGVFTLVEANGRTLPALVYDTVWVDERTGNQTLIEAFVERGRLELADGEYTLELIIDVMQNGQPLVFDQEVTESGVYTVDDGSIELTPPSGPASTGTVAGDEITIAASDEEYGTYTLTFRK